MCIRDRYQRRVRGTTLSNMEVLPQMQALADKMPPLDGNPLSPPTFFPTDWREGQKFTAEDDPDRTRMVWNPPEFVCADPAGQPSPECEEVGPLPYPSDKRFARVLRGVLSEEQCTQMIAGVNDKGFTPALVNIGMGRQQLMSDYRDGHRIIVDSPEMAAWIFERIKDGLPAEFDGKQLVGLNERLRFLCYVPGQQFAPHFDGCYQRPTGEMSMVTVQMYLHDVPAEFGGATTFFPDTKNAIQCQPMAGSVLLFSQNLEHEGSLVTDGLKYTLRTEAMYR
eukprot:TRINITY_DN3079_c0_g1_i1.p1 TRINITY_DN3079_c0_g1~~TRINITY_DN3079_c0_g1_i1.p1  ORF type:complete len:280 (-),score=62.00 TRINITY_DN3079_c0_g1_i1:230-1069(-)